MPLSNHDRRAMAASVFAPYLCQAIDAAIGATVSGDVSAIQAFGMLSREQQALWSQRAKAVIEFFSASPGQDRDHSGPNGLHSSVPNEEDSGHYFDLAVRLARQQGTK